MRPTFGFIGFLLCLVGFTVGVSVFPDSTLISLEAGTDTNSNGTLKFLAQVDPAMDFAEIVDVTTTSTNFKKPTWLNTGVLSSLKDGDLAVSGTPITVSATSGNIAFEATDASKKAGLWANDVEGLVASSSGMHVSTAIVNSVSWATGSLSLSSTAGSVQFYSQDAAKAVSFSLKGVATLTVTKDSVAFPNSIIWAPAGAVNAKATVDTKSVIAQNGTAKVTINNTGITTEGSVTAAGFGERLENETANATLQLTGQTGVDFNASTTDGNVNLVKGVPVVDQLTGEEDLVLSSGATKSTVLQINDATVATVNAETFTLSGTNDEITSSGAFNVKSGAMGDLKFTTTLSTGQLNLSGGNVAVITLKTATIDFGTVNFVLTGTNDLTINGKLASTGATLEGGLEIADGKTITSAANVTVQAANDLNLSGKTVVFQANSVDAAKVDSAGLTVQGALKTTMAQKATFTGASTITGDVSVAANQKITSTGALTLTGQTGNLTFTSGAAAAFNIGTTANAIQIEQDKVTFAKPFTVPATGTATFGAEVEGGANTELTIGDSTFNGSKISEVVELKSNANSSVSLTGSEIALQVANVDRFTLSTTEIGLGELKFALVKDTTVIKKNIQLTPGNDVDFTGAHEFKNASAYTFNASGTGRVVLDVGGDDKLSLTSTQITVGNMVKLVAEADEQENVQFAGTLTSTGKVTVGDEGVLIGTGQKIANNAGNLTFKADDGGGNGVVTVDAVEVTLSHTSTQLTCAASGTTVTATTYEEDNVGGLTLFTEGFTAKSTTTLEDDVNFAKEVTFSNAATFSVDSGTLKITGDAVVESTTSINFQPGAGTTNMLTLSTTAIDLDFTTSQGILFQDMNTARLLGITYASQTTGVTFTFVPQMPAVRAQMQAVSGVPSMTGVNAESGCFCAFNTDGDDVACACRIVGSTVRAYGILFQSNMADVTFATGPIRYMAFVPEL